MHKSLNNQSVVRKPLWIMGCVALLLCAGPGAAEDFEAQIRVNDAPVAGRFTIVASFLDTLDSKIESPDGAPGRALYLRCFDPSGRPVFFVPGDLQISNQHDLRYQGRFLSLEHKIMGGRLRSGDSRAALWWVASGVEVGDGEVFEWESPRQLKLHYGEQKTDFKPVGDDKFHRATLAAIKWPLVDAADMRMSAPVHIVDWSSNPGAYEYTPKLMKSNTPRYPTEARTYNMLGTVHVVAQVDTAGSVQDAFVVQTSAPHLLNASALISVLEYKFRPAYKDGVPVVSEVVIPIEFKNQPND